MKRMVTLASGAALLAVLAGCGGVGGDTLTTAEVGPSFVDPTATVNDAVHRGSLVYVGPFARLLTDDDTDITLGDESNVQDSATVDARSGSVELGHMVILAHGATVKGAGGDDDDDDDGAGAATTLGEEGVCPHGEAHCPSFVSFNAEVDGAVLEKDAMVSALSRIGPGVRLPSGRKTKFGVNITSQAQVAAKTDPVTEADRVFMEGVIHINVNFARGYSALAAEGASNVRGINYDSGPTLTDPLRDLPTFAGVAVRDPGFRNRVIGGLSFSGTRNAVTSVMGSRDSLRADEGEGWTVGSVRGIRDGVTWHALEDSHLELGSGGLYGLRSIVHGGATPWDNDTITGTNFTVKDYGVFFRSRAGNNVSVGVRSLVAAADLPAGYVVPDRTVILGNNPATGAPQVYGTVEW